MRKLILFLLPPLLLLIFLTTNIQQESIKIDKNNYFDGKNNITLRIDDKVDLKKIKLYYDTKNLGRPLKIKKEKDGERLNITLERLHPGNYQITYGNKTYKINIPNLQKTKQINDCYKLTQIEKIRCAENFAIEETLKAENITTGIDIVKKFLRDDKNGRTYCHNVMHDLGELASHISKDYYEAEKKGEPICVEGYYHGLMESYQQFWNEEQLKKALGEICEVVSSKLDKDSCYHGVGHMLMVRYNNYLPDATKACQEINIPKNIGAIYRPQDSCISGAAMAWGERYSLANKEERRKLYPYQDSPVNICFKINGDELNRQACFADITNVYFYEENMAEKIIKECQKLKERDEIGCYQSLSMYMQLIPNTTKEMIGKACLTAKQDKAMWRCFSETITTVMGSEIKNLPQYFCKLAEEKRRYSKEECEFIMKQSTT